MTCRTCPQECLVDEGDSHCPGGPCLQGTHSTRSSQPSEGVVADPPSVCRPLWMTRSLSQCPTLSISCPTLAGHCPPVTQVQVSAGSWVWVGASVGSAFLRVPDAIPDARCWTRGSAFLLLPQWDPSLPPPLRRGCDRAFSLSGEVQLPVCPLLHLLSCPRDG